MTKKTVIKVTIPLFLIIVVVAAMAALRVRSSLTKNVEYFTATIEEGPLQKVINATGSVQTVVTVPVGSQVSGQVQELFADFNSVVKRGQLLAKLDPRNLETQVANSKASVLAAQARVRSAQAEVTNQNANLVSSRANLEAARVTRDNALVQFQRATDLSKRGIASQND